MATVVSPPIAGDAIHLLAKAIHQGTQPPERTLVAPTSFPLLKDLQKTHTAHA
jgi:hypothetical protein